MKHPVGHTQNDIEVHVDLVSSEAAKHIAREPRLLTLAAEALPHITLEKATVMLEHDMGRVIGYDFVVETTARDIIFYGQLIRENTYTRFTKNGKPLATHYLSLILQQNPEESSYDLQDVWIGGLRPPKPGSSQETTESKSFWDRHAFVFEKQPVQLRSLTRTRPY